MSEENVPYYMDDIVFRKFDKCNECNGEVRYDRRHAEHWCIQCGLIQEVDLNEKFVKDVSPFMVKYGRYRGRSSKLSNKKEWMR